MIVYHYHPDTKAYTSSSDEATIPASATAVAPPTVQNGDVAVWGGAEWSVENVPWPPIDTTPNLAVNGAIISTLYGAEQLSALKELVESMEDGAQKSALLAIITILEGE